jgi:flavin reductase (DIM6/NTAB) family NADH-FMN oxidoreductase RutF
MTAKPPDFDSLFFRSALGRFATGVTVVTTQASDGKTPIGLTISSFNSVSLEPPMVLWALSKQASTLPQFQAAQRYVIHVLAAQQLHLAKKFAKGPQTERFNGIGLTSAPNGTLMLDEPECAAWFECYNLNRYEAGDHIIFIGQVERCHRSFSQPLVYHAGDFDLTPSHEPLASH